MNISCLFEHAYNEQMTFASSIVLRVTFPNVTTKETHSSKLNKNISATRISATCLSHSRLRMPQGSPGQGRGMPPGIPSRGFEMFSMHP